VTPFWLGAAALLLFTFATRALPTLVVANPAARGFDALFHLFYIDAIRERGAEAFSTLPRCTPHSAQISYPWGMHWLLARLPRRAVLAIEPLWGGIVDCLLLLVLFAVGARAGLSGPQLLLAGLLASTSPLLLSARPLRAFEITARGFGELLFAAGSGALVFAHTGSDGWYAAAVLCFAVLALSSKFALQALFLVWVPLGVWMASPTVALLPFAAVAAAYLLSAGHYHQVLVSHLRYLDYYAREMQWQHVSLVGSSSRLRGVRTAMQSPKQMALWAFNVSSGPAATFLVQAPALWVVVAAWVMGGAPPAGGGDPAAARLLALWAVAPVFLMAAISLPGLRFLGEAHRYVNFAVLPFSLLAAAALSTAPLDWAAAGAVGLLSLHLVLDFAYCTAFVRMKGQVGKDPHWTELVSAMNGMAGPRSVLSVPLYLARRVAFETHHLADAGPGPTTPSSIAAAKLLWVGHHPFPNPDLRLLRERLGYDTAVFDKKALRGAGGRAGPAYPLDDYAVLYENEGYLVLDLTAARAGGRAAEPAPAPAHAGEAGRP
jgi:hypothetical protein